MKGFRCFIAISVVMSVLSASVCATEASSNKAIVKDEIISAEDALIINNENLNLLVKVIKQVGNERTEIFSGKLKDYDNGKWVGMDFSEAQFAVIFKWDDAPTDDEVIYIIPQKEVATEEITLDSNINAEEIQVFENIAQSTTNVENITYDITYTVANGNMNIVYDVSNGSSNEQTVTMIAALYEDNLFKGLVTEPLTIAANNSNVGNLTLILPEKDLEKCKVRMMVWDSFQTLRPLGQMKTVNNIGGGLNEKTIVLSSSANSEVKVFMNSESLIKNDDAEHIIKYNPQKIEPVDLCGFTYEKETDSGEIANTGIVIKSVDLTTGEIVYTFDMPEGINTGINNFIKFKALTDLSGEEITYVIQ